MTALLQVFRGDVTGQRCCSSSRFSIPVVAIHHARKRRHTQTAAYCVVLLKHNTSKSRVIRMKALYTGHDTGGWVRRRARSVGSSKKMKETPLFLPNKRGIPAPPPA